MDRFIGRVLVAFAVVGQQLVDPARGRGLARQVLSLLVQAALDDGVPAVFLEMYADNEPGARLYRSLGFTEVGRYYSWLIGTGGALRSACLLACGLALRSFDS